MKNFLEGIKDMLYDSIDYIIMIGIIGIVVFVIGWRLDLLFAKDASDVPSKNDIIVEDNKDNKDIKDNEDKKPDSTIDNQDQMAEEKPNNETQDENPNDKDIVESTPENPDNDSKEPTDGKIVKITIPAGSLPSKIGSILESNGLASKTEFVQKAQELKLDTKLKSGDYEIKTGSSIEDIVKLIADKK